MCCLFKLIWGSFDCNGNSSLRHLRAPSTLLLWLAGCKFVKLFMLLEHIKLVCRKVFIDLPQFVAVWGKVEREWKEGGHKNKLYLFISICSTAYSGCLHSSWFRNTYVPRTAINGTTFPSLPPSLLDFDQKIS